MGVVTSDKLFPKAAPHAIKSVELEGNGGPGTLVKINFAEGLPFQYVKHKVEGQDQENLSYSYSLIEGGPLGGKLEKISFENKLVAAAAVEGTLVKSSSFSPLMILLSLKMKLRNKFKEYMEFTRLLKLTSWLTPCCN
ncbi:Major allergen Pru av 1 [Hibiscus syriacus]|uniref:Major allergen Pru av 1 n=1 Tax=Hibiscus syriacus TaxID=106335 RepID=A0A6A3D0D3_HIBSY|nr:Major allergen Pru av 1 [Hibiscus syriacus]